MPYVRLWKSSQNGWAEHGAVDVVENVQGALEALADNLVAIQTGIADLVQDQSTDAQSGYRNRRGNGAGRSDRDTDQCCAEGDWPGCDL